MSLPDVCLLGFFSSGLGDILMAMKMVEREVSAVVKDEVSRKAFKTDLVSYRSGLFQ